MTITIADLKRIADEDPAGFISTIRSAVEAAKKAQPGVTMKFMWGETGVDQYDADAILAALRQVSSGDALASLIAQSVGGVDVNKAAGGDTPQVAATMRSALSKHMTAEIKANPTGELAQAVKTLIAPDVARAVTESIKAVMNGTGNSNPAGAGFGLGDFSVDDGSDPLAVELPGLNRMVG